jgi:hypothetical protein
LTVAFPNALEDASVTAQPSLRGTNGDGKKKAFGNVVSLGRRFEGPGEATRAISKRAVES